MGFEPRLSGLGQFFAGGGVVVKGLIGNGGLFGTEANIRLV